MRQIIFFFIRNKNFLLFALLFIISVAFTISSHSFHKSKYVSSANFFSGGIYSATSSVSGYFNLKSENKKLLDENIRLRMLVDSAISNPAIKNLDSTAIYSQYKYTPAIVINNNYGRTKNTITIKKGAKDGIKLDLGVITSKGIIGIVNSVSNNYATVQSILNTNSQINAKLKKSEHFGFLEWDTKDANVAQLTQIPRLAPINMGDTIVTGGKSTIFPKGILIGTIKDFEITADDSYLINVSLFNDMTNLGHVYVIENKDAEEILNLEEAINDAE